MGWYVSHFNRPIERLEELKHGYSKDSLSKDGYLITQAIDSIGQIIESRCFTFPYGVISKYTGFRT